MLKENKGVTLVALVITIIVLLILAGVTLSMVMGDSGIFSKANDASIKTSVSGAQDAVRLALLEVTTNQYDATGSSNESVTKATANEKVAAQMALTGEYVLATDGSVTAKGSDKKLTKATFDQKSGSTAVTVSFSENATK